MRKIVRDLNRIGRPREVHAALFGYLKNQAKNAEPWMYEALAAAIELNQGSAADVKKSLNFAADLAQRSHNPNHLVSAADQLYRRGYLERVGDLLDEAMPQVPHRSEPMVMSINLAQKTRDPKRMADAVDGLLSLGWPGQDEYFRLESVNQVDTLAKALREEGKGQEADALLARLTASQARDVFVRLSWDGDADYDLLLTSLWAQRPAFKRRARYSAVRSSRMATANTPRKSTSALGRLTATTRSGCPRSTRIPASR